MNKNYLDSIHLVERILDGVIEMNLSSDLLYNLTTRLREFADWVEEKAEEEEDEEIAKKVEEEDEEGEEEEVEDD